MSPLVYSTKDSALELMAALEGAVNPRPITCCYGQGGSFAYHYLLISLIELSAPPPPPPPPLLSAPFYLLSLMENDADTSRPAMPRQPSGDQLGFSFDEPHFAPIIPNILIIEPSTPDRSDSSRNSTEERGCGFVDLVPPEEDKQEKAPEAEKNQKEEHHEGEIVEDMTVSSSPLNERHAIRTVAQMTPTYVDDVPVKEVLDRILTKEALPVRPPTQPEENPPSPSLLLPPENLEITSERMPVVQFTPEVIREHELAEEAAAAAANNRRLGLWERCCIVM